MRKRAKIAAALALTSCDQGKVDEIDAITARVGASRGDEDGNS